MLMKRIFLASLLAIIPIVLVSCAHSQSVVYKQRAGWSAMNQLAYDDCNISKQGGKSLLEWNGKQCSVEGLVAAINSHPEKIPVFYAAYHQYGTPGVRAIDVSDASKMNYLNFARDLSSSLSTQSIAKIFEDYLIDRDSMGLKVVKKDVFTTSLVSFSSRKIVFENGLNQEGKRLAMQVQPKLDEKLGIDYKANCGPFKIDLTPGDGWARINGTKAVSQKITPLPGNTNGDNIQMQWMVPRTDYPGYYGMDYIKRNGKAILNVEAI